MLSGLDVSHYDGALNWAQTASKISFAIIKASEGYVKDDLFDRQWGLAKGNTVRGSYHYFRPAYDPVRAAQALVDWLEEDPGELSPMLDLETTDGLSGSEVLRRARIWLTEVAARAGGRWNKPPMIYTNPGFWQSIGGEEASWAAEFPLVLARWSYDKAVMFGYYYQQVIGGQRELVPPEAPAPWKEYKFWQWTRRGRPEDVPGYPKGKLAVDFDVFLGNSDELRAWSRPAPRTLEERVAKLEERVAKLEGN